MQTVPQSQNDALTTLQIILVMALFVAGVVIPLTAKGIIAVRLRLRRMQLQASGGATIAMRLPDKPPVYIPVQVSDAQSVTQTQAQEDDPREWWYKVVNDDRHITNIGPSGAGKSTTANALMVARVATGHQVAVIDPHAEPGDWNGVHVIGAGCEYAEAESVMRFFLAEKKRRYDLRKQGLGRTLKPITIFLDEFGSLAAHCESANEFMKEIAREGRKIGLHLVILSHSTRVKTLGIEGESDILENFSQILLGVKASQLRPQAFGPNERPAVLIWEGIEYKIDVSFLPEIEAGHIPASAIFRLPTEATEAASSVLDNGSTLTGRHLKTAVLLSRNPTLSGRALARELYPTSVDGTGDYYDKAKKIKEETLRALSNEGVKMGMGGDLSVETGA